MTTAAQQSSPHQKARLGNRIAAFVMIGLGVVVGAYELMHDTNGRQQQEAAAPHHSLHSAETTGSGG